MLKLVNFNGFGWFLCCSLVLFSCSKFRKIEKSDSWEEKYKAALNYYEEKDYYRASILLEQIIPITRGKKEGEKVQFYLAYCTFYEGSYILSSYHFKNFYETYARSEYVEEASYMYAYSLFMDSPNYNLDQTNSFEAINALQGFINKYPNSRFREQASAVINEMQVKLEKKAYENAKQYIKLGRFKSSIVAFDNFKNDFPDSDYNEEIAFLKIKAEYNLASQSILSKQEERYRAVIAFYNEFVDLYPQGQYLKQAEGYYDDSNSALLKIAKITN